MHIIPFNIGDFSQATERFKPVHLGIFLRLLMEYYKTESPLPDIPGDLEFLTGVESKSDREALALVLRRCFVRDEKQNVWIQKRCDREIEQFRIQGLQRRHAILCRYWDKANPGLRCPTLEEFTAEPSKYYDENTRRVRVLSARVPLVLRPYSDRDTDLPPPNHATVTSNQETVNSNQITPIVPKGTDTSGLPKAEDVAEAIYALYPKKVGRAAALKAISKALKLTGITELALQSAVRAYAMATSHWSEQDKTFIPNPSTWFNQHRFMDDPATWQRNETAASTPNSGPQKNRGGRPAPTITAEDLELDLQESDEEPTGWVAAWIDLYSSDVPETWMDVPPAIRARILDHIDDQAEKNEGGAR